MKATIAISICLLSICLFTPPAFSQQAQPQPAPSKEQQQKKWTTAYTLSPEKYQQAIAYSRSRYRLYFISSIYSILLLFLILAFRVAPKYRTLAERVSGRRFVQALIFVPLLLLTLGILSLPTDIYGQTLSLKYDQSVQSWASWAWDWTKGQLIGFVIMTMVLWLLYAIVRKYARRWWFYFWLASLPIIVFLLFISPVIIEPLFFKFDSLEQKQPQLVAEIERVIQRGGLVIPRQKMFEMEASQKLKSVNAYVTGFGASKRVVVWDTTIARMTIPQTLFVFGHEMGHYVLGHIPKTIAFVAVVLFIFLFLGYHGMHWMIRRWGNRWEIRNIEDWASLPVLMLLFSIFSFLATPVFSTYSRSHEHEADVYGLEVIHGIVPDSQKIAAEAFQILGEINLSDPNPSPFIKIWLYDHPPLNERLIFARNYDPWSKGESPKFVK